MESAAGGRTSLWAWEKSGKELKMNEIKIHRHFEKRGMGVETILATRCSTCKIKNPTYSNVIHRVVLGFRAGKFLESKRA